MGRSVAKFRGWTEAITETVREYRIPTTGTASGTISSTQQHNHPANGPAAPPQAHIPSETSSRTHNTIFPGSQSASIPLTSLSPRPEVTPQRVLLIVRKGLDRHLAQILALEISTFEFFKSLRSEYFRLRGFWLRYFSIRRYNHCDFYKVHWTSNAE